MAEPNMIRVEIDSDSRYPDWIVKPMGGWDTPMHPNNEVRLIPRELYESFVTAQRVYESLSKQISEYVEGKK